MFGCIAVVDSQAAYMKTLEYTQFLELAEGQVHGIGRDGWKAGFQLFKQLLGGAVTVFRQQMLCDCHLLWRRPETVLP